MTREDFEQIESSQRQHFDCQRHNEEMFMLGEKRVLMVVSELKPKFSKDGDMWCFLWGETLQEGIAGFGKSPLDAAVDFFNKFAGVNK
jgi:hypothetical protein